MAITVKHTKVSTIPDAGDASLIEPSDWNADHQLVGTVPVANGGTGASTLTGYVKGTGTSAMTAATTIPNTDVTGLGTMSTQNSNNISVTGGSMSGVTISDYVATATKGVANGVASLDGSGTVPVSQLPAAVLGALSYQGTWNATTNTPTLTSSTGTKGYYYVVSVAGTTNLNGITDWQVGDWAVYNGTAWQKIDNTDAVTSVNGYTGTVVLTAADVSAVPYTGATGAVDLNAKSLTNVSNLGVNTTTVPTIKIRAVGDNNSGSRIAMRGYSSDANSSSIRVSKYRGTVASPQAPLSGDSLGKFELAGYGTTSSDSYPQSSLEGVATENWGATARGAKAVVKVTPNTTTTQVTALTINQDSTAVFASTVTANGTLLTGNTGTVTSVAATAGTGISISGSPITTSGTLTVTNTAPDQTVVLTAGTGISTSGTYPNFTITNTSPSSGGTVTSITAGTGLSGGTITSSGTIAIDSTVATLTGSQTLTNKTISGASNTLSNIGNSSLTNSAITINGTSTSLGGSISVGTVTSVTGTAPVVSSGGNTPAISMPAATTSVSGYLTSTDWNTFNGKQAAGTYVNSVSGTTGRITSTGGVTPVIDLASGVATAGTTGSSTLIPVVTIDTYGRVTSITTASNPQGTVTSVTGTAPVVSSGGATPAISMAAATGSVNGYLTSTDWTTFNGKAPSVTYTTNYVPYGQGTTTPNQSSSYTFDGTTQTAPIQRASNGIVVNSKTVSASYSIASGDNAMSAGPITVASGQSVTVASGSRWVIL